MQNQENDTPQIEETEGTTEVETTETESAEVDSPSELKTDEIVEVEWEEIEQLYRVNQYSKQIESQIADLCLRYEKTKQNLLSRLSECETFMYNSGTTLKDAKRIDPEITYELKLPTKDGEKGFFVRKDA